jgi:hypothetical protein
MNVFCNLASLISWEWQSPLSQLEWNQEVVHEIICYQNRQLKILHNFDSEFIANECNAGSASGHLDYNYK